MPMTRRFVKYGTIVSFVALLTAQALQPTYAQQRTLYERLGGYNAIAAVVNEFADRLFGDPKLKTFFGGMSTDSQRRFKQLNIDLVCSATGGPCQYLGRDMGTAHRGIGITDENFDAVARHLVATLDRFKVPTAEKDELVKVVSGLRLAIVERK